MGSRGHAPQTSSPVVKEVWERDPVCGSDTFPSLDRASLAEVVGNHCEATTEGHTHARKRNKGVFTKSRQSSGLKTKRRLEKGLRAEIGANRFTLKRPCQTLGRPTAVGLRRSIALARTYPPGQSSLSTSYAPKTLDFFNNLGRTNPAQLKRRLGNSSALAAL